MPGTNHLQADEDKIRIILDIFAQAAKLPIVLYEEQDGECVGIHSRENKSLYKTHCQYIQRLPGGRQICYEDETRRARAAKENKQEEVSICHAGIYNFAAPIEVEGDVKAVILYGEILLSDEEHMAETRKKHRETVDALGLDEEQASTLKMYLDETKAYSRREFDALKEKLPRVPEWLYRTFYNEELSLQHIQKITHEIQTRIQSILNAEILLMEFGELSKGQLRQGIRDIVNSAQALATVVNNLGKFQREYRFREHRIASLLVEARHIYGSEATRKHITFRFAFEKVNGNSARLEVSREHLQLAFNNLIHNAIKYSFRGASGRERFVSVKGKADGNFYVISIENYGIGIREDEIEQELIFLENYQGELTHGEYRTGSGKGLYFVQQVIKRHHGSIRAFSKQMSSERRDEGEPHLVRFEVKLPFRQPQEKRD